MSGSPDRLEYGKILGVVQGNSIFKANVIADFIISNRDQVEDVSFVSKVEQIFEEELFPARRVNFDLKFPKLCTPVELVVGNLALSLIKKRQTSSIQHYDALDASVQKKILAIYKKFIASDRVVSFLEHNDSTNRKVESLAYYLRYEYIPNEDDLYRRIEDLYAWTKKIKYSSFSAVGREPENTIVNQWEVFPYDATRFTLSDNTYINANLVFNKYILTQSPVTSDCNTSSPCNTVDRFWHMIWEYNVPCIAMINGEPGTDFFMYYPDDELHPKTFSSYTIALVDKQVFRIPSSIHQKDLLITRRELSISNSLGEKRSICHIKAEDWHDFTRGDEGVILKIVDLINEFDTPNVPVVIHCRAGVGRTGQLVTVLHLSSRAGKGRPFDVIDTVRSLRDPLEGRSPYMLQGECQIIFAHRILLNMASIN